MERTELYQALESRLRDAERRLYAVDSELARLRDVIEEQGLTMEQQTAILRWALDVKDILNLPVRA